MEQFDKRQGLILIKVRVHGTVRTEEAIFALDTGATKTVINRDLLLRIGYGKGSYSESLIITTGSGKESTNIVKIKSIEAIGKTRQNFNVLAYQLPVTTFVEGLLGLDFLRNTRVIVDFLHGNIIVE